jgi:hypothetical protein
MSNTPITQTEEEIFTYEVADEALEAAASIMMDKGGNMTVSFCTGLDSCPS